MNDIIGKAFIENRFNTTVGIHYDCPNARYVGGTSVYVCECKLYDVNIIRDSHAGFGYSPSYPLLTVPRGEFPPFWCYHAGRLAIDPERPWQVMSNIGCICAKLSRMTAAYHAVDMLTAAKKAGTLPCDLSTWEDKAVLTEPIVVTTVD